mmetsp:Transcript_35415/g.89651  ORF Transcript_35415/g.89651 Transcript_35415/m.89651 type:complete len:431 (+) Transcript_35415:440-1732(+)
MEGEHQVVDVVLVPGQLEQEPGRRGGQRLGQVALLDVVDDARQLDGQRGGREEQRLAARQPVPQRAGHLSGEQLGEAGALALGCQPLVHVPAQEHAGDDVPVQRHQARAVGGQQQEEVDVGAAAPPRLAALVVPAPEVEAGEGGRRLGQRPREAVLELAGHARDELHQVLVREGQRLVPGREQHAHVEARHHVQVAPHVQEGLGERGDAGHHAAGRALLGARVKHPLVVDPVVVLGVLNVGPRQQVATAKHERRKGQHAGQRVQRVRLLEVIHVLLLPDAEVLVAVRHADELEHQHHHAPGEVQGTRCGIVVVGACDVHVQQVGKVDEPGQRAARPGRCQHGGVGERGGDEGVQHAGAPHVVQQRQARRVRVQVAQCWTPEQLEAHAHKDGCHQSDGEAQLVLVQAQHVHQLQLPWHQLDRILITCERVM